MWCTSIRSSRLSTGLFFGRNVLGLVTISPVDFVVFVLFLAAVGVRHEGVQLLLYGNRKWFGSTYVNLPAKKKLAKLGQNTDRVPPPPP